MVNNCNHRYDRVCNSVFLNCVKLSGYDKPFITIKASFKMGANNQVIPLHVTKKSSAFESYDKDVKEFTKKVCE